MTGSMRSCNSRWPCAPPGARSYRQVAGFANCVGLEAGAESAARVIYYWQTAERQIWLLVAYPKSERDDLSHDEIKQLKRWVEEFEL